MDVSNLCRSCMKEVATEEKKFNQDTVKMFTFCTNIQILSEEQLPTQFCYQCTNTIYSCYTFVYMAREVDHRLKEIILKLKPETSDNSYFDLHKIKPEQGSVLIKNEPVSSLQDASGDNDKKRTKHSKVKNPKSNQTNQMDLSLVDEFKTYICTACSKGFVRKKNYENHMFSYHSIGPPTVSSKDIKTFTQPHGSFTTKPEDFAVLEYPCPHCPEKFETSKDRRHHKREKHRGQLYECLHCSRRFAQRQLLTAHMRKHTRNRQFICNYCNKVFKVKSRLKLHLHMHDDTLKPHLCDACGSRFSHRKAMLNHQLVHTGQKPFTCDLCGYTCRQESNIRRHKRAHLNERKHQCVECGKGFNELSQLKKHMYSHTDERPYKCPHCDNCYKNSDKRKKHLIRVHGMDPSEIPRLAKDGGPARRYVTDDSTPKKQNYSLLVDRVKELQTGNKIETQPNV